MEQQLVQNVFSTGNGLHLLSVGCAKKLNTTKTDTDGKKGLVVVMCVCWEGVGGVLCG